MEILLVIVAATVGSLFSLVGGLYLIYGGKKADSVIRLAVPFAAGALLSAAFNDLLPEALQGDQARSILMWTLAGILIFFIMERGLHWFHHHHGAKGDRDVNKSLIIVGDLVHNLIDGLAIGAAFLVNPVTGVITTVAVAAHEIPQEIGDFALLLAKGMSRRGVLIVNVVSSLATVVSAVGIYLVGSQAELHISGLLALTAGFFIYIAVSDIIPTIHAQRSMRSANIQTLVLLIGVVFVGLFTTYAHGFIDAGHDHGTGPTIQHDHDHEEGHSHGIDESGHDIYGDSLDHAHDDYHVHEDDSSLVDDQQDVPIDDHAQDGTITNF